MERLSALINRLKERHEAGGTPDELLLIVDQLKNVLTGSINSVEHSSTVVSIMMPSGYNSIATGHHVPGVKVNELQVNGEMEDITSTYLEQEIMNGERPGLQENAIEKKMMPLPKPAFTVLRPPAVTVIEEDIIQQIETTAVHGEIQQQPEILLVKEAFHLQIETPEVNEEVQTQTEILSVKEEIYQQIETLTVNEEALQQAETVPVKEEIQPEPSVLDEILGFLKFPKPEKRESPLVFAKEREEKVEKSAVLELDMEAERLHSDMHVAAEEQHEREHFEEVAILETPHEHGKPKELHEILAARVVATHTGSSEGKKMVGDSLGSTRITDLRKGIAVNDRFRYIKSLFRGDETLFDRSIKTINNFNILSEAQYWIQRELVIKFGWNDEDELVQQFYSLVSRRFL